LQIHGFGFACSPSVSFALANEEGHWSMTSQFHNILITGAGFSHSFGLPLGRDLKDILFESIMASDARPVKRLPILAWQFSRHDATIDEIITGLDAASDRGDPDAAFALRVVRTVIADEIYRRQFRVGYVDYIESAHAFTKLEGIFSSHITLNWDSLLEDDLLPGSPPFHVATHPPFSATSQICLKLHGSVNWFILRQPIESYTDGRITKVRQYMKRLNLDNRIEVPQQFVYECPHAPGGKLGPSITMLGKLRQLMCDLGEPAVLVPSHMKSVDRCGLGLLWTTAAILLAESPNITIMGYSLPPDDHQMMGLLRQAICCGNPLRNKPHIFIVDPNARTLGRKLRRLVGKSARLIMIEKPFVKVTLNDFADLREGAPTGRVPYYYKTSGVDPFVSGVDPFDVNPADESNALAEDELLNDRDVPF
jgi:hypothetical protein